MNHRLIKVIGASSSSGPAASDRRAPLSYAPHATHFMRFVTIGNATIVECRDPVPRPEKKARRVSPCRLDLGRQTCIFKPSDGRVVTSMRKVFIPLLCLLVLGTAARSDEDPIKKRKEILKGFGEATKPVASMFKNKQPFDLKLARDALASYVKGSKSLVTLFPDTSKTGGETEARPIIWDEKTKFEALFNKLADDSTAASTTIVDEASFRTAIPKVLGDCKACHDDYREKK